jgi:hypothetical protein
MHFLPDYSLVKALYELKMSRPRLEKLAAAINGTRDLKELSRECQEGGSIYNALQEPITGPQILIKQLGQTDTRYTDIIQPLAQELYAEIKYDDMICARPGRKEGQSFFYAYPPRRGAFQSTSTHPKRGALHSTSTLISEASGSEGSMQSFLPPSPSSSSTGSHDNQGPSFVFAPAAISAPDQLPTSRSHGCTLAL